MVYGSGVAEPRLKEGKKRMQEKRGGIVRRVVQRTEWERICENVKDRKVGLNERNKGKSSQRRDREAQQQNLAGVTCFMDGDFRSSDFLTTACAEQTMVTFDCGGACGHVPLYLVDTRACTP